MKRSYELKKREPNEGQAHYMRVLRQNRKSRGQCMRCGKPLDTDGVNCSSCIRDIKSYEQRA